MTPHAACLLFCAALFAAAPGTVRAAAAGAGGWNESPHASAPQNTIDTELTLTFALQPIQRCSFGDLNAILLDTYYSGGQNAPLLLTIEPLDEAPEKSGYSMLDLRTVSKRSRRGLLAEIQIPAPREKRLYGVFLCKDSDGSGRCRGKRVRSIDSLLKRYTVGTSAPRDGTPPDAVYYFQPLVIGPKTINYNDRGFGGEAYEQLLQLVGGGVQPTELFKGIREARSINSTLGSRVLKRSSEGAFRIRLPYYAEQRCR